MKQSFFNHEALFYSGDDDFVRQTAPFVRDALEAEVPILVAVIAPKIDALKSELGDAAKEVLFTDMAQAGKNPARIIPLWRDFIDSRGGAGEVRGIGEPIWASRSPHELVESQRHEALLNVAFDQVPAYILCPYDTSALGEDVLTEARRSHPVLMSQGVKDDSLDYVGIEAISSPFDAPLPEPRSKPVSMELGVDTLERLRRLVWLQGSTAGLDAAKVEDLVLAVNEIATNTIRHGGGRGVFRMWQEDGHIICEVSDRGRIDEPMVGRVRPRNDHEGGFGLWLVNQLCELVQVRSSPTGSMVRIHMAIPNGRAN